MRIRNLTAASMPEAMDMVRAQLGADAVILSTESNPLDGLVRITAAIEEDGPDDGELGTIGEQTETVDSLANSLAFHRLPEGLANRLLTASARLDPSDPVRALGGAFDAVLTFGKLAELSPAEPIMLVGPPGAGKTSTAAKLCTLARLASCDARMITLDCGKAGGFAQISSYGEVLGAEVIAAAEPEDLLAHLAVKTANCITLIDTPGTNPFDPQELMRLSNLRKTSGARAVLVLPAGADSYEAAETALAFADIGAKAIVATKLDIARRFGGFLAALHATGLPLMAIAQSPHIVEGLKPINPISLARLFFASDQPLWAGEPATGEAL